MGTSAVGWDKILLFFAWFNLYAVRVNAGYSEHDGTVERFKVSSCFREYVSTHIYRYYLVYSSISFSSSHTYSFGRLYPHEFGFSGHRLSCQEQSGFPALPILSA